MPAEPCLLLVSPHADDEVLGAPSLVIAARAAGWRVVNLVCFLDPADRDRRLAEVERATAVLQIELWVASEPLLSTTARSKPSLARELLAVAIGESIETLAPAVVMSPGPHDVHYAHEAVANGVRAALEFARGQCRWIMWGWWGELSVATTVVYYGEEVMATAQEALAQHRGELARLDLSSALEARARWNAAVGPERVMGPGFRSKRASRLPYADVVVEVTKTNPAWTLAEQRITEADRALKEPSWSSRDLTALLDAPSASALMRA